jgi:hypothetical protein
MHYEVGAKLDLINSNNGIYIQSESVMLKLLAKIDPNLCKNYVFVTFEELTRIYIALIIRKERVEICWNR